MIDIRKLFDHYSVEYRDHGPNTSRGHINVACPFCGNDPSYHLAINESTLEWYCFRNARHSGHNLSPLFTRLHIPKSAYAHLVPIQQDQRRYERADKDYSLWNYFTSASTNEEALRYLSSRNFLQPEEQAKKFNLRVTKEGEWCGRILIPLTIGWTGRSMRDHISPRYDAYTSEDGFYYYSNKATSAIVVEGAIDGMRIASVSTQFDVYGKCRMEISSALINQLVEKKYASIWGCPDSTVPYTQKREEIRTLRSYCTSSFVGSIDLVQKDFGALTENEARSTLRRVGYDSDRPVLRQSI